jgi:hypothetical protein
VCDIIQKQTARLSYRDFCHPASAVASGGLPFITAAHRLRGRHLHADGDGRHPRGYALHPGDFTHTTAGDRHNLQGKRVFYSNFYLHAYHDSYQQPGS